jgi:putative acetyltransferase
MTATPFIREESGHDRAAVRALHRAAFGGDVEADLVDRLHADGDALFGLVAERNGQIAGHILFSRLPIETRDIVIQAAALAPLAVLPEWQGQGIGAALVERGLSLCQERGIAAVVVLGDPAYYTRFGFRAETAARLQTPWSGPHLMAIELAPSSLGAEAGIASYPAAFSPRIA